MKVEVAVLGSPSLTVLTASGRKAKLNCAVCRLVFTENRPNLIDRT